MPDVHLPHLDDQDDEHAGEKSPVPPPAASVATVSPRPRRGSFLKIVLEVVLITTGVFLGLAGEQWREHARHREMAEESLRRFRTEILANRKAVLAVKDYHVTTLNAVQKYFAADDKARAALHVNVHGIQPAFMDHTAWDLALATQALVYLDPQLSFSLTRIYATQQEYAELTHGILQAMYLRPPEENLNAFLQSIAVYYGDVVGLEPSLLTMYDEILPQIDRALAGHD